MQSFEINKADLERIKVALDGNDVELKEVLQEYHASEIAILFEKLPIEAREKIINILPSDIASEVIAEMHEEQDPGELLIGLDPDKRTEIIEELDYDDATDIISQLDEDEQQEQDESGPSPGYPQAAHARPLDTVGGQLRRA